MYWKFSHLSFGVLVGTGSHHIPWTVVMPMEVQLITTSVIPSSAVLVTGSLRTRKLNLYVKPLGLPKFGIIMKSSIQVPSPRGRRRGRQGLGFGGLQSVVTCAEKEDEEKELLEPVPRIDGISLHSCRDSLCAFFCIMKPAALILCSLMATAGSPTSQNPNYDWGGNQVKQWSELNLWAPDGKKYLGQHLCWFLNSLDVEQLDYLSTAWRYSCYWQCVLAFDVWTGVVVKASQTPSWRRANMSSKIFMAALVWISLFFGICIMDNDVGGGRKGKRGPRI